MEVINFIKEYWVLITFFAGQIGLILAFVDDIVKKVNSFKIVD